MLRIQLRQMYRSDGLIDDVVVYGTPEDYQDFSKLVKAALSSSSAVVLVTDSPIYIEILKCNELDHLFTSLQNENNEYFSKEAWGTRNILRIFGSESLLSELSTFLSSLSGRGEGYSYISEFSDHNEYSNQSPEWRLHIQNA